MTWVNEILCVFSAPKFESSIPEEGSFVMKTDPDDNLGGLFVPSGRRITRKGSRKGRKSKDSAQVSVCYEYMKDGSDISNTDCDDVRDDNRELKI